MKTNQSRLSVEWIVTRHVAKLSVRVLYGRGTEKRLTISDQTVEAVWLTARLGSLVAQRIDVVNPSVLKQLLF
jgi:hypothetical protein